MLKGPAGYTDAKVAELVDMNVEIGNEIWRSLVSTHLGESSSNDALAYFSAKFHGFMRALPPELKHAYEWATEARCVRV